MGSKDMEKEKKEKKFADGNPASSNNKIEPITGVQEPMSTPTTLAGESGKWIMLDKHTYAKELSRLQIELVKLQEWVRIKGLKVVVIFEGRDAAGKARSMARPPPLRSGSPEEPPPGDGRGPRRSE